MSVCDRQAARLPALLVTCALLASPQLALAQEGKPDFAAAKQHFKAGQAFLDMERYGEAVREFKEAYAITKDGLVMGQVALAFEKAGDYEAALEAIRVYHAALPEGDRASAEALIQRYEKLIQEGRSKKLILPGEEPTPQTTAEPSAKEPVLPPPQPEPKPRRHHRLYTWIAAGAAGALALSALVLGLNAQSKYDDLANSCKPSCRSSEVDSVEKRALATDILWGTAAAAAVTAGVLYFVEGRSLASKPREPLEEESEEIVTRRFQLAPVVGSGSYGVGAHVTF